MAGDVIVERQQGGIAVVTLARPEARNAMTLDMANRLTTALREAGADPDCRVIVLAAQGNAFCAGLDLKAHPSMDGVVEWMRLQEGARIIASVQALSFRCKAGSYFAPSALPQSGRPASAKRYALAAMGHSSRTVWVRPLKCSNWP